MQNPLTERWQADLSPLPNIEVRNALSCDFSPPYAFMTWCLYIANGRSLTCHEGREEKQRYNSTISLTSELDGVGLLTPRPGRFTPGKQSRYPGPQSRTGRVWKVSLPPGFDPRTVRPVGSRYAIWAIQAHRSGHNISHKLRMFSVRLDAVCIGKTSYYFLQCGSENDTCVWRFSDLLADRLVPHQRDLWSHCEDLRFPSHKHMAQ